MVFKSLSCKEIPDQGILKEDANQTDFGHGKVEAAPAWEDLPCPSGLLQAGANH